MFCFSTYYLLSTLPCHINRSSPPAIFKAFSALLARLTRTGLLQSNLPSSAATPVDVATWNALVAALSRHGFPDLSIQTFSLMHCIALPLDSYSLCSALTAAASITPIPVNFGKQVHAYATKSGEISSIFVRGALIDFYSRTEAIQDAHHVFDEFPVRNTVCLNALLNGYVEKKLWKQGLLLFQGIYSLMLEPDVHTITAVLRICAEMSFIGLGMQCHAHLIRKISGMKKDAFLLSSLVEMYGKCGFVGKAHFVFEMSKQGAGEGRRDVVLWTSVLNAYGRNGQFDHVISAFEDMLAEGTEPDEILMLVVLSACARSGNVTKGLLYLESMVKVYKLVPRHEHYSCIVNLLCRAGELLKALNFVSEINSEDGGNGGAFSAVSAWGAILSACSDSGNAKIGKLAFQRGVQLDPYNVGIHVELSNFYARVGMWDELAKLRRLMGEKGMKKDIGCSRFGTNN